MIDLKLEMVNLYGIIVCYITLKYPALPVV